MDFYNPTPPPNNNNAIYIVILVVVLTLIGLIIYFTYDDIMTLFENSKYSPSPSSSTRTSNVYSSTVLTNNASSSAPASSAPATNHASSSAPATNNASSSSPATNNASSSAPATNNTSSSSPATQPSDDIEFANDGTKNIGQECNTDDDCKSTLEYPLVCTEEQQVNGTNSKKCRKPIGGREICYRSQCNHHIKQNLTTNYFTLAGMDAPRNFQNPCYKCDYRVINHNIRKYQIPTPGSNRLQDIDIPKMQQGDGTLIDYKALYNGVCIKNRNNVCDPSDDDIDISTGRVITPST